MKAVTKHKLIGLGMSLVGPGMLFVGYLIHSFTFTYFGSFLTITIPLILFLGHFEKRIVDWLNRDD